MCTLDIRIVLWQRGIVKSGLLQGGASERREMDDALAVNMAEAARRLGVSPRTVATLVARKELPSRKIGRRRVIPIRALEEFLRRDHQTGNEKARAR